MITISKAKPVKTEHTYGISCINCNGKTEYKEISALTPKEATLKVVRMLGGGPATEIGVYTAAILSKPKDKKQLFVRADLLGGTRDSTSYYFVNTKVDWSK